MEIITTRGQDLHITQVWKENIICEILCPLPRGNIKLVNLGCLFPRLLHLSTLPFSPSREILTEGSEILWLNTKESSVCY